jgi:hypothetical protein
MSSLPAVIVALPTSERAVKEEAPPEQLMAPVDRIVHEPLIVLLWNFVPSAIRILPDVIVALPTSDKPVNDDDEVLVTRFPLPSTASGTNVVPLYP